MALKQSELEEIYDLIIYADWPREVRRSSDGGTITTFITPERQRERADREGCGIITLSSNAPRFVGDERKH